jgi:cyclophilin family peptidyl-prolyl cis-trans isomerase
MTRAVISTDKGDIELELFDQSAPKTTKNFIDLARKGFYDDVIFHRVIPNFMIQGGDGQYGKKSSLDTSRVGTGGPGYKFEDEPVTGSYTRGTLAMANAGPNTNGSQFFICHVDVGLPKSYTIFGQVTKGLDVVDAIAAGRTGPQDRPVEPVAMTGVRIEDGSTGGDAAGG